MPKRTTNTTIDSTRNCSTTMQSRWAQDRASVLQTTCGLPVTRSSTQHGTPPVAGLCSCGKPRGWAGRALRSRKQPLRRAKGADHCCDANLRKRCEISGEAKCSVLADLVSRVFISLQSVDLPTRPHWRHCPGSSGRVGYSAHRSPHASSSPAVYCNCLDPGKLLIGTRRFSTFVTHLL